MLYLAIGLFVLAAGFGLIALAIILNDHAPPKPIVLLHGGIAATALLLVIFYITQNHGTGPILSLILLIVAALGGLTLFIMHRRNKPMPQWLTIAHPLVAVIGILTLIIYVLTSSLT